MQNYIKALRGYCKRNPLNHGDAESVMEFLYWHYAEINPIENEKIRNSFAKLRRQCIHTCLCKSSIPFLPQSAASARNMSASPSWKASVWV